MNFATFRPSYPDDRALGYRLGSYLWAECVGHAEHSDGEGEDLGYLIYTRDMRQAPAWTAIDKLLDELSEEYRTVLLVEDRPPKIEPLPGKRTIFVPLIRCRNRRT